MSKEELINKLTLIDTADYRRRAIPFLKEPPQFRLSLATVYSKLSIEDIRNLFNIRNQ